MRKQDPAALARSAVRQDLCADGVLSVRDAAAFLGLSRAGVYALANAGKLQSVKVGSRILIPRRATVKFLADHVRVR